MVWLPVGGVRRRARHMGAIDVIAVRRSCASGGRSVEQSDAALIGVCVLLFMRVLILTSVGWRLARSGQTGSGLRACLRVCAITDVIYIGHRNVCVRVCVSASRRRGHLSSTGFRLQLANPEHLAAL